MMEISKSTMWSLVAFFVTFTILMIIYVVKKPDFVMEKDDNNKKQFSLRLSMIYSLLFASVMGLLVVLLLSTFFGMEVRKTNLVEIPPTMNFARR